jgi:A/G-specific adenine glycosylase
MTEVPGSEWAHDFDMARATAEAPHVKGAAWRRNAGVVRHVFTHFPLELAVFTAHVARRTPSPKGARWVKIAKLSGEALPNVMRKVIAHALDEGPTEKSLVAKGLVAKSLAEKRQHERRHARR